MRSIAMIVVALLLALPNRADGQVALEFQVHHSVKNGDLGDLDLGRGGLAGTGNVLAGIAMPLNGNGKVNAVLIAGYNNYGSGRRSISDEIPSIDDSGIAEGAEEIIEGAGDIIERVGDFLEGVASGIDREYERRGIPVLGGLRIYDSNRKYFFQAAVGIESKRSETTILGVGESETEVDFIGSVGVGAVFWRGMGASVSYNASQGSWRYLNVGVFYRFGG